VGEARSDQLWISRMRWLPARLGTTNGFAWFRLGVIGVVRTLRGFLPRDAAKRFALPIDL
jgi:hypothetical protein